MSLVFDFVEVLELFDLVIKSRSLVLNGFEVGRLLGVAMLNLFYDFAFVFRTQPLLVVLGFEVFY